MTQPDDHFARAASFLRTRPEPGWDAIADRVIAAVRATPRQRGWPLRAQDPPGHTIEGQLYVSDNVVRSTLVMALRERYLCVPTAIAFDIDDGTIRSIDIEVTGSYGTELHALADRIRATTRDVVADLLGAPAHPHGPIDITVTNVVTGDPLHS